MHLTQGKVSTGQYFHKWGHLNHFQGCLYPGFKPIFVIGCKEKINVDKWPELFTWNNCAVGPDKIGSSLKKMNNLLLLCFLSIFFRNSETRKDLYRIPVFQSIQTYTTVITNKWTSWYVDCVGILWRKKKTIIDIDFIKRKFLEVEVALYLVKSFIRNSRWFKKWLDFYWEKTVIESGKSPLKW